MSGLQSLYKRMRGYAEGGSVQDFYDIGLLVEGGGNMQAPSIRRSDFAYYEAQGEPTMQVVRGGGDSGQWTETVANPNYRPAGYYLTPEAQQRLGPQWTKNDATSVAWGGNGQGINGSMMGGDSMGSSFNDYFSFTGGGSAPANLTQNNEGEIGYWDGSGDNQIWVPWTPGETSREAADQAFNDFWNQDSISGMVKTADKGGTGIEWVREGDTFVPRRTTGTVEVDTNNDHTLPVALMATLGAAAYAAPLIAAEAGAAGAGGAVLAGEGAMTAAEAFALADSVYGAANLGYTAAELAAMGGAAGSAAAVEAAAAAGMTVPEAVGAGMTFNAATGVWSFAPYVVEGVAAGGLTAAEIAAGVGAGAGAVNTIVDSPYEPNWPQDGPGEPPQQPPQEPSQPNPYDSGDPYHPGDLPNPEVEIPKSFPSWEKALEWALKNPQLVGTIVGGIGSLVEGNGDEGGGGAGGGWNQPPTPYRVNQTVTPAPAGYRPGFSPEHVYLRTAYEPGVPQQPTQTSGVQAPPPLIPPLPPTRENTAGIASLPPTATAGPPPDGPAMIDPETAFTQPTGVASIPDRNSTYTYLPPGMAGTADRPYTNDPAMAGQPVVNQKLLQITQPSGIASIPRNIGITPPVEFAQGGLTRGPGDGMSDDIPATISGQEPAALSPDEFVVPADVVSGLGNGSSEAGAKVLYAMMDRVRQARHGSKQQARQINPSKILPA